MNLYRINKLNMYIKEFGDESYDRTKDDAM